MQYYLYENKLGIIGILNSDEQINVGDFINYDDHNYKVTDKYHNIFIDARDKLKVYKTELYLDRI